MQKEWLVKTLGMDHATRFWMVLGPRPLKPSPPPAGFRFFPHCFVRKKIGDTWGYPKSGKSMRHNPLELVVVPLVAMGSFFSEKSSCRLRKSYDHFVMLDGQLAASSPIQRLPLPEKGGIGFRAMFNIGNFNEHFV
jgi:hypothetical protein